MTGSKTAREKELSIAWAQAKIEERIRQEESRARQCQCKNPVPELGTYLGWHKCRLCQRLIPQ